MIIIKEKLKQLGKYLLILVIGLCSTPIVNARTINDSLYIDKNVSFWMATTKYDGNYGIMSEVRI